jgi:hypothetical protein
MNLSSSILDVPRPLVDPITSLLDALSVVSLSLRRPRRNDTVVLALDAQRRGLHLFRSLPMCTNALHHIVNQCSVVSGIHSVVITSVRPTSPLLATDQQLLVSARHTLSAAGIDLIDWVVLGAGGLYCPRTLCGIPDPWPYGNTWV